MKESKEIHSSEKYNLFNTETCSLNRILSQSGKIVFQLSVIQALINTI